MDEAYAIANVSNTIMLESISPTAWGAWRATERRVGRPEAEMKEAGWKVVRLRIEIED